MTGSSPAVESDPIARFRELFARAEAAAPADPTAMALATADADGNPSVRWVLLRGVDARGFVFYTNYESRKGRELAARPAAALAIYWPWLEEQVRIEGEVERLSAAESDTYFASRPRGHQLGAWASEQSRPLGGGRSELEARLAEVVARFGDGPVPRPPHWGGFRIVPRRIEFWRGRADRLHDREVFLGAGDSAWRIERLYP